MFMFNKLILSILPTLNFIFPKFNAALNSVGAQISEIAPLNETNFSTRKEQNEIYLGVLEIDQTLRVEKPAA
jgi:hypothetical protein